MLIDIFSILNVVFLQVSQAMLECFARGTDMVAFKDNFIVEMISISTQCLLSDPEDIYIYAVYICNGMQIKYCLHQG